MIFQQVMGKYVVGRKYIQEQAILTAKRSRGDRLRAVTAELSRLEDKPMKQPVRLGRCPAQRAHRRRGIWDAKKFVHAVDCCSDDESAFSESNRRGRSAGGRNGYYRTCHERQNTSYSNQPVS